MSWILVFCLTGTGCATVELETFEACARAAAELTVPRIQSVRCIDPRTGEVIQGTRREWEERAGITN